MLEQYQRYFDSEIIDLAECESRIISKNVIEVTSATLPFDVREIFNHIIRPECLVSTSIPTLHDAESLVIENSVFAVAAQEDGLSAIISIANSQPEYYDDDYVCHGTIRIIHSTAENHKQIQDDEVKRILTEMSSVAVAGIVSIWHSAVRSMDEITEREFAATVMKCLVDPAWEKSGADIVPIRSLPTLGGVRETGTYLAMQMVKLEIGQIIAMFFQCYPIDSFQLSFNSELQYNDEGGMYRSCTVDVEGVVLSGGATRTTCSSCDNTGTIEVDVEDIRGILENEIQTGWEHDFYRVFQRDNEDDDIDTTIDVARNVLGELLDSEKINGPAIIRRLLMQVEGAWHDEKI